MKSIVAILFLLSLPVLAQNAPATVRNPYPNYWCSTLPQHIRHSPVPVPCPPQPGQIQAQPLLQPSPNDPPLDIQKKVTELGK